MRNRNPEAKVVSPSRLRCAIYMCTSTEEGLDQEFSSLDAQREASDITRHPYTIRVVGRLTEHRPEHAKILASFLE